MSYLRGPAIQLHRRDRGGPPASTGSWSGGSGRATGSIPPRYDSPPFLNRIKTICRVQFFRRVFETELAWGPVVAWHPSQGGEVTQACTER